MGGASGSCGSTPTQPTDRDQSTAVPCAAPSTGTAITCAAALSATPPADALYFRLLPADVVSAVDTLVSANAWRWAGALCQISLPILKSPRVSPSGARVGKWDRFVTRDGQDLFLRVIRSSGTHVLPSQDVERRHLDSMSGLHRDLSARPPRHGPHASYNTSTPIELHCGCGLLFLDDLIALLCGRE